MVFNDFLTILAYLAVTITFIGSMVWWLAAQFKATRDLIYRMKEEILSKLEYHEQHDDKRFEAVRNDIWEIRLRNAIIDGKKIQRTETEQRKQHERRSESPVS